jgi:hypothetical protein
MDAFVFHGAIRGPRAKSSATNPAAPYLIWRHFKYAILILGTPKVYYNIKPRRYDKLDGGE